MSSLSTDGQISSDAVDLETQQVQQLITESLITTCTLLRTMNGGSQTGGHPDAILQTSQGCFEDLSQCQFHSAPGQCIMDSFGKPPASASGQEAGGAL